MSITYTVGQLFATPSHIHIILLLITCSSEYLILIVNTIDWFPDIHIIIISVIQRTDFTLISHKIIRTHHFGHFSHFLKTERSAKIHLNLSFFTTLGSNDNYTISTTCTVNSCRRSIFQDINTLNFRRSNVTDTGYRKTVYYIKRWIVLRQRTTTTYTYLNIRIGRTLRSSDIHPRHFTGQCFGSARYRNRCNILRTDGSYGTGQVSLIHRTVTNDNNFIQ